MTYTLPWPPVALSPNSRTHWAKLQKAKREYRQACAWSVKSQGAGKLNAETLHLTLTFYAPTKRAFDLDNALARIKSDSKALIFTPMAFAASALLRPS